MNKIDEVERLIFHAFFKLQLFFEEICFLQDSHYIKSVCIRSYSSPHFLTFGLNIQSECGKMRTRMNNSDYGHFSRSDP